MTDDKSGQPFIRSLVTPTDPSVDGCPLLSRESLGVNPTRQGIVTTVQVLTDLSAALSVHQQFDRIQAFTDVLLRMSVVQFLPLLGIKCALLQGLSAIHDCLPILSNLIAGRE